MRQFVTKSGKNILVRGLERKYVKALHGFYVELAKEDTFIWANPDEMPTMEEQEEEVESYVKNKKGKIYWLGFDGDKLVAYVSMDRGGKRRGHVGNFGVIVAKDYRSDGIGEALSRMIIEEAKNRWGLKVILLDTFDINEVAVGLYKKLGFTEYGRRIGTVKYKDGYVGEVMMFKEI